MAQSVLHVFMGDFLYALDLLTSVQELHTCFAGLSATLGKVYHVVFSDIR